MRYITSLNSQWFQKYKPSKLKDRKNGRFSTFFRSFNFDGSYFWNHLEFRDVMYLNLKVWSVVKWSQKLKGVTALLPSTTPLWKRPFYSIKGPLLNFICPPLYSAKWSILASFCHTNLTIPWQFWGKFVNIWKYNLEWRFPSQWRIEIQKLAPGWNISNSINLKLFNYEFNEI